MSALAELDVFRCPLEGISLIEASAGTGKTWNICGLYLRLLLERDLDVAQILVVTFTNAATAELRARIRARLVETLAYLRAGATATPPHEPFVAELVRTLVERTGSDPSQLALRLEQALAGFEEAAIFTIHGFCQRALGEAAFSAGLPFSLELVADEREIALETVNDFWRRRVAAECCPAPLAVHLRRVGDTPEKYAQLLARHLAKPLARYRWPAGTDAPVAIDTTALDTAYATARATWSHERDTIVATAKNTRALHATYYQADRIEQVAAEWDLWFGQDSSFAPLPKDHECELLSAAVMKSRTKAGQRTPTHRFYAQAEALLARRAELDRTLALARMRLVRELVETAAPDLRRRKRERRVIAFDDMLYNLYAALAGGEQPDLAAALAAKFPVALIDEFQDTDPLQFAIFERIYTDRSAPAFFVGDPKQAIYSFRHADLHAYLRARRRATAEYTLAHNQRASEGLIEALNALFGATNDPFRLPGLDYHAVALGTKERKPCTDTSLARAPLQFWTFPSTPAPIAKPDAQTLALRATAAEIARLVAAGARDEIRIGERALAPGDIAVLVRTHAQGSELKRELAARRVGSVELAQTSVFQTVDAEELERVLIAINDPREDLLRGALATEMIGCDAARIVALSEHEREFATYVERFARYRDLWRDRGAGVMYRKLLADEHVYERMLRRSDGERRLTNLLHLAEELQQASGAHEAPDALIAWLGRRRREATSDEAAQLRLESDRNLVQIVTIHKAKGLEFPIVFCPFLWDGYTKPVKRKLEAFEYHDAAGIAVVDYRLDDELAGDAAAIEAAIALEEAAETVRLIYVAATRAMFRCYLIAGTYAKRGSTAESCASILNSLVAGQGDGARSSADIAAAWAALAKHAAPHLDVAELPRDTPDWTAADTASPGELRVPPPPHAIAPAWRIASFTGLVAGGRGEHAANDHDARFGEAAAVRLGPPPPALAPDDILRFPRGPGAGDCLHAIFERIDFTEAGGWRDAIALALARHPQGGVGDETASHAGMAARMLAHVLATPLPDGIVLGAVAASARLTELEFCLPLPRLSTTGLQTWLVGRGYDIPRLALRELEGYLKGFIDLVFERRGRYYVLDWKSNHLGYASGDYGPQALRAAMAEHGYHLQYLLYTLALDRYLKRCVPGYRYDEHFGGVLYLFVRGVRPDWRNGDGTPAGVFHHRPAAKTIAALDAMFTPVFPSEP